MTKIRPVALLTMLIVSALPLPASAWNIPGHMLSAAIAYQVLQQESPQTIEKVKAVLKNHPWYSNQWQARLQEVSVADHGIVLFMHAARWPDDIRFRDKQYHRGPWHYINWPFKPEGQPVSAQTREPESVNILTAMAENGSEERERWTAKGYCPCVALPSRGRRTPSPYTRRSYSRRTIPRATEAGMKSVFSSL
jgi:S1/P1 Nuclease